MKKLVFSLFLPLMVFMFSPGFSRNTTARYLLWQPSARAFAMGGTGVSLTDDAFAVFYNPAALARIGELKISNSYVRPFPFFANIQHSLTAVALSLGKNGTVALSINRFWKDPYRSVSVTPFPPYDTDSDKTTFFKPTHWNAKLSYGRQINNHLALGVNVSILRIYLAKQNIVIAGEEGSGNTFTPLFGCGLLVQNLFPAATFVADRHGEDRSPSEKNARHNRRGISLGLALQNAGPQITMVQEDAKDKPPTVLVLGMDYRLVSSSSLNFLLASDFEKQLFESSTLDYIHLGSEVTALKHFSLRLGYFLDSYAAKTSFFTWGGGIRFRFLSLNFARYNRSLVPTWHFDGTLTLEI